MLMNPVWIVLKDKFSVLLFRVLLHLCLKFTLNKQVVKLFYSAFTEILLYTLEMQKCTFLCMHVYMSIYKAKMQSETIQDQI